MAAVEQHRRLAVGSCQLKPAGRGLVGDLHLRDNAGERSIAKTIFGKRQDLGVLAALGIEDFIRPKADLLKARRVEIETRNGPKDGETGLDTKARRDSGCKQGGAGIVGEARRGGSDFMQPGAIEAMIREALVHFRETKGQGRSARRAGVRQACAKRGKLIDLLLVERREISGHGNNDSICSLYVPLSLQFRQATSNSVRPRLRRGGAEWPSPAHHRTSDRGHRRAAAVRQRRRTG